MPKSFKLKSYSKSNKIPVKEYKELESPYVKEKSKIIRPVYFDFMNYDEPPKVKFNMTPSLLWGDEINSEENVVFSDEE